MAYLFVKLLINVSLSRLIYAFAALGPTGFVANTGRRNIVDSLDRHFAGEAVLARVPKIAALRASSLAT